MQQHLFNNFSTSDYCGFLENVLLNFIDKPDSSDPLKQEMYQKNMLKTITLFGLILKKVCSTFITKHLSIFIFKELLRTKVSREITNQCGLFILNMFFVCCYFFIIFYFCYYYHHYHHDYYFLLAITIFAFDFCFYFCNKF